MMLSSIFSNKPHGFMADVYGFEDTVMEVNNRKAIKQTCGH